MFRSRADYLVIGSGIAGLSFALRTAKARPHSTVVLITKDVISESNTWYAQGGMASVLDKNDSPEQHIADTLAAGDGLCDPEVVRFVVEEGPHRIHELMACGVEFDRRSDGSLHLAREGGHRKHRVVHKADQTGKEIESTLIKAVLALKNVTILEHHFAVDLVRNKNGVCGAVVIDLCAHERYTLLADATIIACGGIGQVYQNTSNPLVATGDGIAMAWRAGATISNIEYVQFHPTALYTSEGGPLFLITEALRGAGARLINTRGERFMSRYHPQMELACRDVVSRAVFIEMHDGLSPHVLLDCREVPQEHLLTFFPAIYRKCLERGIDPTTDLLPVAPVAHYSCGGVQTDHYGRTSVPHLYAIGESACTGLHGANRLASNSLTEALVFAARCSAAALGDPPFQGIGDEFDGSRSTEDIDLNVADCRKALQEIMTGISIVSDNSRLELARQKVSRMKEVCGNCAGSNDKGIQEFRNLVCVSSLIIDASLRQCTNRGAFYKVDNVSAQKTSAADLNRFQT